MISTIAGGSFVLMGVVVGDEGIGEDRWRDGA